MGRPLKVLQFIDSLDPGGAETMLVDLSLGLRELGLEITIGHFGNPWLAERCHDEGIAQSTIDAHRWYKSTWTLPAFVGSFAKYIKENNYDAVHAHLYGATVAAAIAGRLIHTPIIGTLHDSYTLTERPARIRLLQLAAMAGAKLVSVAHQMEDQFCSMGRFNATAWRTIHNGIDTQRFQPCADGTEHASERASLDLPVNGLLIGSVGRLVPLKRFAELIRICCQSDVDAHLVIIGDGPERPHLQALIDQLAASDRVHLLGQRNDIAKLLPLFDLFTLWSETEGLSCSIAEAMSCGLPALVSDVGGNHELITHDQSGYLIPAEHQSELAAHLQKLCIDNQLRRQIGAAARLRIENEFSLTTMINAYAALLDPQRVEAEKSPAIARKLQ